ncbi:MAG TPA: SurA N-terminal domain-containing protein [Oligoflexia bacterium]|nr:SurA N-terminal domain-containing protein [Oligoflexia bacterium]HMR25627.1 SurA N-terminal domain-containing protein [Oligoflexia bacterium]
MHLLKKFKLTARKQKNTSRFELAALLETKPLKTVLLLGFMALCLHAQKSFAKVIDKVVARVNNEIILLSDLESTRRGMLAQEPSLKELSAEQINDKVIDQLINDKLVDQEIKARGFTPSESDVDASVTAVMQQNGMKSVDELKFALKQEGIAFEEYKKNLAKQQAQGRLMAWLIRPKLKGLSKENIKKILEEKKQQQASEKKDNAFELYMLFKSKQNSSDKAMQKIDDKIKSLDDFIKQAKKHTEGPAPTEGGYLGVVKKTDLKQNILEAAEALNAGQKSNIIEDENGYYILFLKDKRYVDLEISDEMIEAYKQQEENKLLAKAFERFVIDLRRKANIQKYL